jgi:hypothetical protein
MMVCYDVGMRRSLLLRGFALFLAWLLMPGTGELLENAVHLVREGHLAHAPIDAEHESAGTEHDCSGPYHFCVCHTSNIFLVNALRLDAAPSVDKAKYFSNVEAEVQIGYSGQPFRPPIVS